MVCHISFPEKYMNGCDPYTVYHAYQKAMQKVTTGASLAITIAQKINITSQNAGSSFSGISDTVPKAIINPKN